MFRAALKSLLGRKLRLLLSTFAIVLGVAFVAGSLIFSDTLSRSFTALFASTVGDVVVRPVGGDHRRRRRRRTADRPRVASSTTCAACRAPPGSTATSARSASTSSARRTRSSAASGPRRSAATGPTRPPATASRACRSSRATRRTAPDEVVLDERHRRAGRLRRRRHGPDRHRGADQAMLHADAGRHRRLPRRRLAQRRDARRLRHPDRAGPVPGRRGRLHRHLGDRRGRRLPGGAARRGRRAALPDGVEAVTGDDAADESASDLLEAISFLTTFLLIFAGIALVVGAFLIVNTFSILVAQRSRELALLRALGASQAAGDPLGAARGVRARRARLDARARPRRAAGDGDPRRCSRTFGLDLSGQPLIFAPRTVIAAYAVGDRRDDGGGLAAGPADRAGSRRCRRCATTSRCPSPRCAAGCCSGVVLIAVGVAARGPRPVRRRGPARRLVRRRRGARRPARRHGGQPGDQPPVPARRPARPTRGCSAPSATWPARTRCATRGAPPPPRRR